MITEDNTSFRLSPVEGGENNVIKLRNYLDELQRTGQDVPRRENGEPNLTKIANACGLRRGVLHTNKAAISLLREFLGGGDETHNDAQAETHSSAQATQIGILEQRVMHLEQKLAVVTVERDELRNRLARYQVAEEVLKSGRRLIA
jgi:hypothetical protein